MVTDRLAREDVHRRVTVRRATRLSYPVVWALLTSILGLVVSASYTKDYTRALSWNGGGPH